MKSVKFIVYATLIFITISCSENQDLIDESNLPFISISEDTDFSHLSLQEQKIVFSAVPRFNLTINDYGLFETKIKSGREVNISENIFNFFIEIFERSNLDIIENCGRERVRLISRGEYPGYTGINDCLAKAITYAQSTYDYDYISDKLYTIYGPGGVPSTSAWDAMKLFGNVSQITNSPESGTFSHNYIFIITRENGSMHALNGAIFNGDVVFCWDANRNGYIGYSTSQINAIYMFY